MTENETGTPRNKPWYKKWRYIIPIALLVLVIAAVASSPDGNGVAEAPEEPTPTATSAETPTSAPTESASPSGTSEATEPQSGETAEGDQGIVFGEPVVFEETGITTAGVMVENVSNEVRTFTAQATFRSGDSIAATAVGAVNDLAPGERRAATLLVDESPIPDYDNVRVQVDTMLEQGSTSRTSEIAAQLSFGEPRITSEFGLTTVTVELTNNSDTAISLTVGAAFLAGDELLGIGIGAVNELAPGETQTAELLFTGTAEGHDEALIYAETILPS